MTFERPEGREFWANLWRGKKEGEWGADEVTALIDHRPGLFVMFTSRRIITPGKVSTKAGQAQIDPLGLTGLTGSTGLTSPTGPTGPTGLTCPTCSINQPLPVK